MQMVFYLAFCFLPIDINHGSFRHSSVIDHEMVTSTIDSYLCFNQPSFCEQVVQKEHTLCKTYDAETSCICVETGLCVSLSNTHV